jgi:hypothetical protein
MRARSNQSGASGIANRARYLLVLALALAGAACNGGSTGTSTGNPNDGSSSGPGIPGGGVDDGHVPTPGGSETGSLGGGYCDADKRVLDGVDADTTLGFTAADILAFAQGAHVETIRWHDSFIATLGPEMGEHKVTITLNHEGGAVRLMTPKAAGSGSGIEPAIDIGTVGGGCQPWLEIDVKVAIATDGGALDEAFDATLRSRNALFATMFTHPDPEHLGGAFAPVEILEPGFELAQLDLSIGFTPFGVSGSFDGVFEMRTKDSVGAAAGGGAPFADFGRTGCKYNSFAVGFDDMVEGAAAQDVLDRIDAAQELAIDWDDGTRTNATLSFTPAGDGACVLLDDMSFGDVTFVVDGQLALASEDGKVTASWKASARSQLGDSGKLEQVQLLLDNNGPQSPDLSQDIPGADVSAYDSFGLNFTLTIDEQSATGELNVTGFKFAPCASDPGAQPAPDEMSGSGGSEPSQGASTPGCRGADQFPVLNGAITLRP